MDEEEIFKNAEARIEGSKLYEKLVETGLAKWLEEARDGLNNGWWSVNDRVEVAIEGEDGQTEMVSVRTPNKGDSKVLNPNEFPYAIDSDTYELFLNTTEGWKRTKHIMRFVRSH